MNPHAYPPQFYDYAIKNIQDLDRIAAVIQVKLDRLYSEILKDSLWTDNSN